MLVQKISCLENVFRMKGLKESERNIRNALYSCGGRNTTGFAN